ncbi:MAG: hypothetical protein QXH53_04150 [Nitrososphaerales archaeon]
MGIIKKYVEIIGSKKSKRVEALLNSSAFRNYLPRVFKDGESVNNLGFYIVEKDFKVILADGTEKFGVRARFDAIKIEDRIYKEPEAVIMDNLVEDAIIGSYLMQELGIILHMAEGKVELRKAKPGAYLL